MRFYYKIQCGFNVTFGVIKLMKCVAKNYADRMKFLFESKKCYRTPIPLKFSPPLVDVVRDFM